MMLECNLDDMNPEIYGYFIERALERGALDVFMTPTVMKKNRPGIILSVLCEEEKREGLEKLIFRETTTLGVRRYPVERSTLDRRMLKIKTKYGVVTMKAGFMDGKMVKYAPEYEECKEIAQSFQIPIKKVYEDLNYAMMRYLQQG